MRVGYLFTNKVIDNKPIWVYNQNRNKKMKGNTKNGKIRC